MPVSAERCVIPGSQRFSCPVVSVLAGRNAHFFFENLRKIGGAAKAGLFGDLRDGKILIPEQRQALLDPVIQQIVEQGDLHMLPKEAAAFASADIYVLGYVLQRDLFPVMAVEIIQHCPETFRLPDHTLRGRLQFHGVMEKQCLPESGEFPLDLQLVCRRGVEGQLVNVMEPFQGFFFPCDGRGKADGRQAGAGQHRLHKAGVDPAALEPGDQSGQEGNGKIFAVPPFQHPSGVEGVGIAEQAVARLHVVDAVVDLVFHIPGQK